MKNIIERASLIAQNNVLVESDLGLYSKPRENNILNADDPAVQSIAIPDQGINLGELLESIEKKYMEQALRLSKGNESKAARLLEMNHHTFRYKWKKLMP